MSSDPGTGELLIGCVTGVEPGQQPCPGPLGVVVGSAAQQPADAIEQVAGATAVAGLLALDTLAYLVNSSEPQPHDVEGVEHSSSGWQRGAQRAGVTAVRVQRGHPDPGSPARVALAHPADQR